LNFFPLSSEAIEFIRSHENADINALLLKHKTICNLPASFVVDQIQARKKAKTKLPSLYNDEQIVFPPSLNLEQSSSEETANFKSTFISTLPIKKDRAADLTGGFGIDTIALSKVFKEVHYVEPNKELLEIVRFNLQQLSIDQVKFHNTTAEEFIAENRTGFDLIYIDPSRRAADKKVVSFKDCSPDITALQTQIFGKAEWLFVKAAPMLDIKQGLRDLAGVSKVTVLSVKNDCKEILFLCHKGSDNTPAILAVNLDSDQEDFSFTFQEEESTESTFSVCKKYLYEPNASILKAGAFKAIGSRYGLDKLHVSTHLYTSDQQIKKFPGRVFEVLNEIKPEKKLVTQVFPIGKANIMTRNYPLSPDEIKKRLGLQDGGDFYLIAFTDTKRKMVIAKRVC
jgi:hypothetical protein